MESDTPYKDIELIPIRYNSVSRKSQVQLLTKLYQLQSISIRSNLEEFEVPSCFNPLNQYKIYPSNSQGQVAEEPFLKIAEKAAPLQKCCCPFFFRDLELVGSQQIPTCRQEQDDFPKYANLIIRSAAQGLLGSILNKAFDIIVVDQNQQQIQIGRIAIPYRPFQQQLRLMGQDDKLRFIMQGTSCQLGVCCKLFPCQACSESTFQLLNAKLEPIQTITKFSASCFSSALMAETEQMQLTFPQGCGIIDKILLIAGMLLFDYKFYDYHASVKPQPPKKKRNIIAPLQ